MSLYGRLMGLENFKIPVHQFRATLGEFARGQITGPQAQAAIAQLSGAPLNAGETTEVQTLLATFTGTLLEKVARADEVDSVLLLAETRTPPYDTSAAVQTRLGV